METDSFHHSKLSNLDFDSDESLEPVTMRSRQSIPLSNEIPRSLDLSHLPREILKSSTVENLISQNEDLMARLKVSLRRLSILETENQQLNEEARRARLSQSSVSDQILILKEKDSAWKAKFDQLEKEKEIQSEKSRALTEKVRSMTAELARHIKYHERIKTQVKPYITELKAYSRTQELKVSQLESASEAREALISDLRHQIIEVTRNSRFQVETSEKKSQEMLQFYESQIETLNTQLTQLQQTQEDLELKSLKLHKALERQDALENEVITIRRSKEEIKNSLEKELSRRAERVSELTKQNQKLGVEHADLQIRVMEDQERLSKLQNENLLLQEQLESLRYMWAAKNEEHEKLKGAAAALERLNIELSQKLNQLRKVEDQKD